ncbi:hypothetical protein KAR91_10100 [Candidatus Pacearchaeota archaeon]|nr:hypothetical protein [Candidatus Pacearchaeota archaeon]
MLKFKKEDVGLYTALTLMGAGTGLLVGATIASRLVAPVYIPAHSEEEWDEAAEKFTEGRGQTFDTKIARGKKSGKQRAYSKPDSEETKELNEFIMRCGPSPIQIEMIKSGVLSMDKVEDALIQEELAKQKEPYNYNTIYLEDDKPDLDEIALLPDEIETIDERWIVSSEQTTEKSKKNIRRCFYDIRDDSFYTTSRQGHDIPLGSVNDFVPDSVWDIIEPYLLSDMGPIFVNDLESTKHFEFNAVGTEDVEDSSVNDAVA